MTRNIVVNGRCLARRLTGVERHAGELLRFFGRNCQVELTRRQGWRGHAWEQCILPRRLGKNHMLWSPANTGPLLVRNQALTIHDLSPLEHPEWFQPGFAAWYRLFLPLLVKQVQRVFVPSAYVKEKVSRRLGIKNVTIAPNGVSHSIFCPAAPQTACNMPARYILFVGTLEPRKNLEGLLGAWGQIKEQFRDTWLVIVGVNGNVFKRVSFPQDLERVRFLGYVDDQTLAGLYAHANLFVLPSFEEGFGLPALEAMACGTPALVSDGGALPEVVGQAAKIFPLADPDGFRKAMSECLDDASTRLSLREKGIRRASQFSWGRTAELVWKELHEI